MMDRSEQGGLGTEYFHTIWTMKSTSTLTKWNPSRKPDESIHKKLQKIPKKKKNYFNFLIQFIASI